jgi:hypothetical protein
MRTLCTVCHEEVTTCQAHARRQAAAAAGTSSLLNHFSSKTSRGARAKRAPPGEGGASLIGGRRRRQRLRLLSGADAATAAVGVDVAGVAHEVEATAVEALLPLVHIGAGTEWDNLDELMAEVPVCGHDRNNSEEAGVGAEVS